MRSAMARGRLSSALRRSVIVSARRASRAGTSYRPPLAARNRVPASRWKRILRAGRTFQRPTRGHLFAELTRGQWILGRERAEVLLDLADMAHEPAREGRIIGVEIALHQRSYRVDRRADDLARMSADASDRDRHSARPRRIPSWCSNQPAARSLAAGARNPTDQVMHSPRATPQCATGVEGRARRRAPGSMSAPRRSA